MIIILAVGAAGAVLAVVFAYSMAGGQVIESNTRIALSRMVDCDPRWCLPIDRSIIDSHSELEDALARTDRVFDLFNQDCNNNDQCIRDKWQGDEVDRRIVLEVPRSEAQSILQSLRDSGIEIYCVGHLCDSEATGFQIENKMYSIQVYK